MKLWLNLLGVFGLSVFGHHEAEEIQKTLHPRDGGNVPSIRSASHDLALEHVEPAFPTIQPLPQLIEPTGIASSEAFGTPSLSGGPSA